MSAEENERNGLVAAGQSLDRIHRINYLTAEMNALYHQASRKLGLSDSASQVLYTICDHGESCLLSDIYRQTGVSKQTINSAIRRLEQEGEIYLRVYKGKAKEVVLTERGKRLAQTTVMRLFEAENNAFSGWTKEEVNQYIRFLEHYLESLGKEIEKIEIREN